MRTKSVSVCCVFSTASTECPQNSKHNRRGAVKYIGAGSRPHSCSLLPRHLYTHSSVGAAWVKCQSRGRKWCRRPLHYTENRRLDKNYLSHTLPNLHGLLHFIFVKFDKNSLDGSQQSWEWKHSDTS